MAQILVLGGAGYIGSHTCKRLAQSGFTPVVFDNLSEGHAHAVKWGELIEGDIQTPGDIAAAIEQTRPAAIIHFAAHTYVGESVEDPGKYYQNNVIGTLNVANAARDAKGIPIVFSSSCATYGLPSGDRLSEDMPQNPINPYGRTKLVNEMILRDFSSAYGLRSVCLRYFNAAGCDAELEIGEEHSDETHLIPRAILAQLGVLDDFKVFGTDYPTPDGTAIRDYIHVTDLADAHIAACRHLLDGGASDQVNVGTGQGYSVSEIVKAVQECADSEVPLEYGPRRAGDPPILVSDTTKARTLLNLKPEHSDLKNIVETAYGWFSKIHKQS